tara:strand:- start:359 stop:490 length:132 start_codon:yes stop_codon:yes gene_type:complete
MKIDGLNSLKILVEGKLSITSLHLNGKIVCFLEDGLVLEWVFV